MMMMMMMTLKSLQIYFIFFLLVCSFDYLRIKNDKNETIGTYCGQRSGQSVRVTGKHAMISFHSDQSVTKRGYELLFLHVFLSKYIEDVPLFCHFQSRNNDLG